MYITILQVGKTKDTYLAEGEEKFLTMLRAFAKVETITVDDEEKLQKHLASAHGKNEHIIILERTGKELSSEEFAAHLGKRKDLGEKILFVIGGPFGLDKPTLAKAHLLLSFSRMTFTHQMMRVILLEQIYRACTILAGKSYHY